MCLPLFFPRSALFSYRCTHFNHVFRRLPLRGHTAFCDGCLRRVVSAKRLSHFGKQCSAIEHVSISFADVSLSTVLLRAHLCVTVESSLKARVRSTALCSAEPSGTPSPCCTRSAERYPGEPFGARKSRLYFSSPPKSKRFQ